MPTLAATADLLHLLGDPSRVRLLALLAEGELSVAELTAATQLAQSRVSTHLAKLRDAGLVRDRRAGVSSIYAINEAAMPSEAKRLFSVLRETADDPLLEQDAARLREVVAARAGGGTWADSVAGSMERHYSPGRTWEATLRGLLGFLRLGDVLDVASGDGALAELLAPRARSIRLLDRSEAVIEAARRRLGYRPNVGFTRGDMHALPFDDASFDEVLLMNCLTHTRTPERVIAEAARVLRPGGALVGVTLKAHRHVEAAAQFDHVTLGFAPAELERTIQAAGFDVEACQVTSREKRPPHFEVVTLHARRRSDHDTSGPRPPRATPPARRKTTREERKR